MMIKMKQILKRTLLYKLYNIVMCSYHDIRLMLYESRVYTKEISHNKVVFSSFNGKRYDGQPRWISEVLQKSDLNLDLVWILEDGVSTPNGIRTVEPNTKESIYELQTASVWIDNCRKKYWIKKKRKQLYIQTWHGPICLKYVEMDAMGTLPPYYVLCAKCDSKKADYIVAETLWRKKNIKEAFWYSKGNIIEAEFKRKEYVDSETYRKKVKKYYGMNDEEGIILYVPTFRKDNSTDYYLTEFSNIIIAAERKFHRKYRVIVRLHPNIMTKQAFIEYSDSVLNGSCYPIVDELIVSADMLVSDYSGCIFDGFKANKFVFLYCPDIEQYISNDRGIYFDLQSLPAFVSQSEEELIEVISSFEEEPYLWKVRCFNEKVGYYANDACNEIEKIILEHISGGE